MWFGQDFRLSDSQRATSARTSEQRQTRARLSQANNFSFEKAPLRTSAREHLGMAGNSASLSVTCDECFSSTSEGWAEYWALQPPNPDRIYGVQQQVVLITHVIFQTNCCTGLTAGVLGWCLSPGIIAVILCFHNTSTTLFQLLTIHLVWCDLNKAAVEDFHIITARCSLYILCIVLAFTAQTSLCLCGLKPQNKKCWLITGIPHKR